MVSRDNQIVTVFAVIGITLWYASQSLTDSWPVQFAILIGVGVVLPALINQWRARSVE